MNEEEQEDEWNKIIAIKWGDKNILQKIEYIFVIIGILFILFGIFMFFIWIILLRVDTGFG